MRLKKIAAVFITAIALGSGITAGFPGISLIAGAETSEADFIIEGSFRITGYNGDGGDVVIPDGVIEISDNAFSHNKNITSLTIPAGCKRIGFSAFYYCTGLKSVTFEGDMEHIGMMSFLGCSSLEKIIFKGNIIASENDMGGGIDCNAFMGCRNLKTVEFAETSRIDAIERAAFMDCASLTEVKLPNDVGRISEYVFMNCPELTRLEIPSMTELDPFAAGYMYDEETEKEVLADGTVSVRADISFVYEESNVAAVVQKPITLIVTEGSSAEEYARSNGIAYEYISESDISEENPSMGTGFPAYAAYAASVSAAIILLTFYAHRKTRKFSDSFKLLPKNSI